MALNDGLRKVLLQAIQEYDFPFVTYDFTEKREIRHQSMRDVEARIREQLLADKPESIRDGLSNVLYWGYARTGYRWNRITGFRTKVTEAKLLRAGETFRELRRSGVREIAKLRLPQFTGLSFVSKVRMFLDPINYVVLDIQLLKLRNQERPNIFHEVSHKEDTSIRITKQNEVIYEQWCSICRRIAANDLNNMGVRAVDVERGVFHLVQTGRIELAAQVIVNSYFWAHHSQLH